MWCKFWAEGYNRTTNSKVLAPQYESMQLDFSLLQGSETQNCHQNLLYINNHDYVVLLTTPELLEITNALSN